MEPRWYTVLFRPNQDKNGSSIITTHVIKKFLRKSETEFPNKDSYKQLKKEILRIFGPRPETRPGWTSFIPGQGIERRNLPAWTGLWLLSSCHQLFVEESTECSSKAGIAHLKLTSATFNQITQLADVIHMYNLHVASSSMSSLNAVTSSGDQLNETQPGLPYTVPEVNAIKNRLGKNGSGGCGGRGGRVNRGNRGAGNSSVPSASSSSRHRGSKHPDLPSGEWTRCSMHHKHGKGVFFCSEPVACQWNTIYAPRPSKWGFDKPSESSNSSSIRDTIYNYKQYPKI